MDCACRFSSEAAVAYSRSRRLRGVLGLVPSPGTQRRDGGAESDCEADSDKQDEIGQFGLS